MSEQPGTPRSSSLAETPPRLLLALALVGAAALSLAAAVLAMLVVGSGGPSLSAEVGLLGRIQYGARLVDGVVLLIPLAVLLARLVEPHAGAPAHPAVRSVLLGATAVGSAATFLLLLRVVADLGGGDFLVAGIGPSLLLDVGQLLVAAAGAFWAYRELQRTPSAPSPSPPPIVGPPPGGPGPPSPHPGAGTMPPGASPPGFPTGPPPPRPDAAGPTVSARCGGPEHQRGTQSRGAGAA